MQGKMQIGARVAVSSLIVCLATVARAGTNEVQELKFSATGLEQETRNGKQVITHDKLDQDNITNIARGRALDDPAVENEKLALARDWSSGRTRIIVYDTSTGSNDVTLGEMTDGGMVETAETGELVMSIDLGHSGSSSNHVDGGSLMVSGGSRKDVDNRPTSIKASVVGIIHTTVTENGVSRSKDVVIRKGRLSTGRTLGEFED